MFRSILGLLIAYLIWRFIIPQPWPKKWKWLAGLVALIPAYYYLANHFLFGSTASSELPFSVLITHGWLLGVYILLALFILLKDVAGLLILLLRKLGLGLRPFPRYGIYSPFIAMFMAMLLSGILVWQGVRVPEVRTVELRLPGLPPELHGLRIVQISDLHASMLFLGPWGSQVVERVNALKPDLVLLTGDLVDGRPVRRKPDVEPLRHLQARLGVFAVPGNHAYYSGYTEWMKIFNSLGVCMLPNKHVQITDKGALLTLAGVTDPVAGNFSLPAPNLQTALIGAPKKSFVILMAHRPGDATEHAKAGVGLQLSGHTHGGQIFGPHLLAQYLNQGFVSGQYQVGKMQLYVNNGAGLWGGFPLRLGRSSEIAELLLLSTQEKDKL